MPEQNSTTRLAELAAQVARLEADNVRLTAAQHAPAPALIALSVEGLDTLILRLGADDRVTYANAAFCRAFKLQRPELVGQEPAALRKLLPAPVVKALARPETGAAATRIITLEDGRVYEAHLSKSSNSQLDVVLQDTTDKERLKAYVRRYVSADLATMPEAELRSFQVPERRFMSVSFTDLRGFTAMSERLSPEEVRATVNACLEEIIHAIEANRATVDKIVGDEVMAIYGAPRHYADHALRAISSACDQIAAMRALQAEGQRTGRDIPACGIGLNTGEMVLGNMGSSTRQNYTVLGAAVNLAARLCGAAAGMEILCTEATLQAALAALPPGWQKLEKQAPVAPLPAELTGKTEAFLPLPAPLAGRVVECGPESGAPELRFRYLCLAKVKGVAAPLPVIAVEDLRAGATGQLTLDDAKVEQPAAERIFGKYRLLELAGRGGMGEVWKARDAFGNLVAVKMLLSGEGASDAQIKRFRREAEVMSRLAHHNICRIHEVGEVDRMQFIAMEYLEGATLADVLHHTGAASSAGSPRTATDKDLSTLVAEVRGKAKSRPPPTASGPTLPDAQPAPGAGERHFLVLPVQQTLSLLLKTAAAVQFAHEHGILHRDLKPANVMIRLDGEPVVMDFGLARLERGEEGAEAPVSLSLTGQIVGTLEYMSPEQAESSKGVDERADVYSLGAILYQMVTGRRHFTPSGSLLADAQALQTHTPIRPRDLRRNIDPDLEVVILKALRAEPRERYPSVRAFADDLGRYKRGEVIQAKAPTLADVARKWVLRNRAVSAVSAAALLLLLLSSSGYAWLAALLLLLGAGAAFVWRLGVEKQQALQARLERVEQERLAAAEKHQADAARLALFEEEKRRQEEWLPVCDFDFAKERALDPRFEAVFCLSKLLFGKDRCITPMPLPVLADGGMKLSGQHHGVGLAVLRWQPEVGDDLRVECEADSRFSVGLAVGGDSFNGYRAVHDATNANVVLDTIRDGHHVLLARNRGTLKAPGPRRLIRLEKSQSTLRVWVDGDLQIDHYDPLILAGAGHRTFAVSSHSGTALIHRLCVWRRRSPQLVPALETGRELLRRLRFADAEDFLRTQVQTHGGSELGHEARLLLAHALLAQNKPAEALGIISAFAGPTRTPAGPRTPALPPHIHLAALQLQAELQADNGNFHEAVRTAQDAQRLDPGSPAMDRLASRLFSHLLAHAQPAPTGHGTVSSLSATEQRKVLAAIAQLPLTHVSLSGTGVRDLSPLRGMPLTSLECVGNQITDLAPLKGMPLTSLMCSTNEIADLAPLKNMPLNRLDISHNPIADLAPLQGMPLTTLRCYASQITDLSPLKGMPLTELSCDFTQITDLSPLKGMHLTSLCCQQTQITDLSPLRGLPLTSLNCRNTKISDLSPLQGMPLTELYCCYTQITDLSPLRGMPLTELHSNLTQITELSPLRGMPLTGLRVWGVPMDSRNLEIVGALNLKRLDASLALEQANSLLHSLPSLEHLSGHKRELVQPVIDDLLKLQQGLPVDLRQHAEQKGDFRWLSIPLGMTRQEAAALARAQGAWLACPSTAAKAQLLTDYYHGIVQGNDWLFHHLGLSLDPERQTWTWDSGEDFAFTAWQDPAAADRAMAEGQAAIGNGQGWRESSKSAKYFPLLEWPATPAPVTPVDRVAPGL